MTLTSTPGARFAYCNLNYAILGRLVELISSESFAHYVEKRIFAPLNIMDSQTSVGAAQADGLPDGSSVWFGHDVAREAVPHPGALPDGYLISSAVDMAHYMQMQLGNGTFRGVRVVSTEGLALMHSVQARTPAGAAAASTKAYGFGWARGELSGHLLLAHDGDVRGFHANVALLPDDRRAIVVLVARNGFFVDTDAGYLAGIRVLAGGGVTGPSSAFQRTAWVIVLSSLGVLGWLVTSFARRRRRVRALTRRRLGVLRVVVGDLLLAVGILVGVFGGGGLAVQGVPLSPWLALSDAPDVTTVVLTAVALVLARAFATLGWTRGERRSPRARPPVGSSAL